MTQAAPVMPRAQRRTFRLPVGPLLVTPAMLVVIMGAVGPLAVILLYSFGTIGFNPEPGIGEFVEVFSDPYYFEVYGRTLGMAACVAVLGVAISIPLAFVVSRARGWARTGLVVVVLLPLMVNIVVRNLGWLLILRGDGLLNALLAPFGLSQASPGTLFGVAVVLVHVSVPLVVLPLLASIDSMDRSKAEAAAALGATPLTVALRVTLPAIAPGLIAGGVLSFIMGAGSLATPMFIGQGRVTVISTLMTQQITLFRWQRAAVFALLLFVIVLVGSLLIQRILTRLAEGRRPISRVRRPLTAQAFSSELQHLGRLLPSPRVVAASRMLYTAVMVVFLLLPIVIVVKNAFDSSPVPQLGFDGITLEWFARALSWDGFLPTLLFSLGLAASAAAIGLVIASIAAWGIARYRFRGRSATGSAILLPMLLPDAAFAIGFVLLFIALGVDATFWRLLFAHVVVVLPFMFRIIAGAIVSVDRSTEEAAAALGARPGTVFRRVTLAAIGQGVLVSCIFGFMQSFDESSVSVLLATGDTTTLPIRLLSEMSFQPTQVGNAIATVMIVLATAVVVIFEHRLGLSKSLGSR